MEVKTYNVRASWKEECCIMKELTWKKYKKKEVDFDVFDRFVIYMKEDSGSNTKLAEYGSTAVIVMACTLNLTSLIAPTQLLPPYKYL